MLLQDPRHAFPVYNPAPLVRDPVLRQSPGIAAALNPLAGHLTTSVVSGLITKVSIDHQPLRQVAREFLVDEGLL